MAVLLLRLAAPLQAWGSSESKYNFRNTQRKPTKSGVIGMIAAALGMQRNVGAEMLTDLNALRFGVRIEREGKLLRDFHMVSTAPKSDVTERCYLCDAVFLAALESDDTALLERIETALRNPVYPLYLGRRSCPPTLPLVLGIRTGQLSEVLQAEPALGEYGSGRKRIVLESKTGNQIVQDVPLSFSQLHRQHGYRRIEEIWQPAADVQTEHDAFAEL